MNLNREKLHSTDKDKILSHLKSLPPEDCYMRFGQYMSAPSLENYVEKINFNRDMLFCISSKDQPDVILGLAHLAFYNEHSWPVAEVGLSVSPAARSQGIGKQILSYCIEQSQARGAKKLYVQTMKGNKPMYRLMQKFNAHIEITEDDATICFELNDLSSHEKISSLKLSSCEVFEKLPSQTPKAIVVFIHGAGGDAWQWRRYFMPYFSQQNIYSLAVSLPNHGESANSSWELQEYLDIIAEVHQRVSKHNFNVPIMMCGHSMGGWLVQKYASSQPPERLDAICLLASIPPYNPHSLHESFLPLVQDKLHSVLAKEALDKILGSAPPIEVEKITVPVFCVSGEKDRVILPDWNKKTSFYYRAPLYHVDSGHNVMTSSAWQETALIINNAVDSLV